MSISCAESVDTTQECCWQFGITDTKLRTGIADRNSKFYVGLKYCNTENADVACLQCISLHNQVIQVELFY